MSTETEEKDDVFAGWTTPEDANFLEETLGTEDTLVDINTDSTETVDADGKPIKVVKKTAEQLKAEKEAADKRKQEEDTFNEWNDDDDYQEDGEQQQEEEEEEEEDEKEISNIVLLNKLKEKGLLNFELEDGEELTEETADAILEDKYDETVDERVAQAMKELPDTLKELIKYSLKGGNPDALMAKMVSAPTNKISADMDMSIEGNQEAVIRAARIEKGEDKETIDSYIDFLKDSKKLSIVADKEFQAVQEKKKNSLAEEAKTQAERTKLAKQNARTFRNEVVALVNNKDNGVKLSRQEKQELPDYMTNPTVELKNGNHISQMQSDIFEALRDKEKALKLAKLLKNNFDFTDFIVDAKTEVVKKVHGTVKTGTKRNVNRSSQPKRKSLADMID